MAAGEPDSLGRVVVEQGHLIQAINDRVSSLGNTTDSLLAAVPDSVRDTAWVGLVDKALPAADKLPTWLGYVATAVAAVLAGVLAQWFRVRIDNNQKRRHLVDELFTEFAVLERMTEVLANQYERESKVDHDNLAILDFSLRSFDRLRPDLPLLRFGERASVLNFYRELSATRALLGRGLAGELSRGEIERLKFELRRLAERFGNPPNVLDRVKDAYDRVMWRDIWWETSTGGIRQWFLLRRMIENARKLVERARGS